MRIWKRWSGRMRGFQSCCNTLYSGEQNLKPKVKTERGVGLADMKICQSTKFGWWFILFCRVPDTVEKHRVINKVLGSVSFDKFSHWTIFEWSKQLHHHQIKASGFKPQWFRQKTPTEASTIALCQTRCWWPQCSQQFVQLFFPVHKCEHSAAALLQVSRDRRHRHKWLTPWQVDNIAKGTTNPRHWVFIDWFANQWASIS